MYLHFLSEDARTDAAMQALRRAVGTPCDQCSPVCHFTLQAGEHFLSEDVPDLLILPFPPSRDGIHPSGCALTLHDLRAHVSSETLIVGYGDPPAELSSFSYYNLEEDSLFISKNAELTAEGAVSLLLNTLHEKGLSLDGTATVILGYGRIARGIVRRLEAFGTHFLIGARSQSARMAVTALGHTAFNTEDHRFFAERGGLLFKEMPHILINTVPAPTVLDGLSLLPSPLFLLELSGKNDVQEACRRLPYPMIDGRSLPAKRTARAAGEALADAIKRAIGDRAY